MAETGNRGQGLGKWIVAGLVRKTWPASRRIRAEVKGGDLPLGGRFAMGAPATPELPAATPILFGLPLMDRAGFK